MLVMMCVGDGAQRHGHGGKAGCLAPPCPPSIYKWCKKASPLADGVAAECGLFRIDGSFKRSPAKRGGRRGNSPSAGLFLQCFSGGRKALAPPEAKAHRSKYFTCVVKSRISPGRIDLLPLIKLQVFPSGGPIFSDGKKDRGENNSPHLPNDQRATT